MENLDYAKLLHAENRSVLSGNNASIGNKPEILANLEKQYLKDRIPAIIALMGLGIGSAIIFAVLYVLTTPLEVMMKSGHSHPILNVAGFIMPMVVIFITGASLWYVGYYELRLALSRDRAQLLYDRLIKHGKVETGDALSINHINGEYEINYSFVGRGMFGGRPRTSGVYFTSQPPPFKPLNTIVVLYTTHLSVIL